jgi:hypothetical protein
MVRAVTPLHAVESRASIQAERKRAVLLRLARLSICLPAFAISSSSTRLRLFEALTLPLAHTKSTFRYSSKSSFRYRFHALQLVAIDAVP